MVSEPAAPTKTMLLKRRIAMNIASSGSVGFFSAARLDAIVARICELYLRGYIVRHTRRIGGMMGGNSK
jgi:hypothetical protein